MVSEIAVHLFDRETYLAKHLLAWLSLKSRQYSLSLRSFFQTDLCLLLRAVCHGAFLKFYYLRDKKAKDDPQHTSLGASRLLPPFYKNQNQATTILLPNCWCSKSSPQGSLHVRSVQQHGNPMGKR